MVTSGDCYFEAPASFIDFFKRSYNLVENFIDFLRNSEPKESYDEIESFLGLRYTFGDVVFVIILAFIWHFFRKLCTNFISEPLAVSFNVNAINRTRLAENMWFFISHTIIWTWIAIAVLFQSGSCSPFYRSTQIWKYRDVFARVPQPIRMVYLAQVAYYCFSVYAIIKLDEKRKDFYPMCAHHFVTLMLLSYSYATRAWKIGLLVMFIHDFCDIILDISKSLHNLAEDKHGNKNKTIGLFSTLTAILFPISWIILRLYLYPTKVIYAMTFFPKDDYYFGTLFGGWCGLLIIYTLDWYWFMLILQYVIKMIKGKGVTDPSVDERELKGDRKRRKT